MRPIRCASACVLWALCLTAIAGDLGAQSFQGGLRGAVKDAQGVIPGATVTLVNDQTNVSRETTTNGAGEYSFPAVDPATYSVKASVPGFRGFERKGIRIGTQQFLTLDITLEVGALAETITVTAEAPLVETSNASHGEVLDSKTIDALPSVGRNVFLLSVTVPTVVSSGDTHWNRMQDQTGASAISLGGGAVRGNNYLLDGFPVTDIQNRSSTNPSAEMLEDVRVQVHTYDAEMGRTGGGVLNTTARTGSNVLRGSGFFQNRPNSLIGTNFFLKIRGIENQPQYWRVAGGGLGGPIVPNKTFFWAAGEGYRDGLTQNGTLHFPTEAMKRGDFSRLTNAAGQRITIYDPLTVDANGNRQPFSDNQIPPGRINPVGAALVKYLPTPNVDPDRDNGRANYAAQDVIKDAAQQGSLKIDHHFNEKVSVSGVYLYQNSHEPQNNFFPEARFAAPSYQLDRYVGVLVLNNRYVISPSLVATLRFGWNKFDDNNSLPFDFDTHTLGWNRAFADAIPVQKYPSLTLTGYNGTGFTGKADRHYYSRGFNGSITKLKGEHSFKFGADYRTLGIDALTFGASAGSYTFNGQFSRANATQSSAISGNAIADLLLGYPSAGSLAINSRVNDFIRYYSAYAQDDWRVNDRLTLNYGLRLEHETGLAERDNQIVVGFDKDVVSPLNVTIPAAVDPLNPQPRQVKGGLIYAGVNGAPTQTGNPPAIKASPRLGIVYKLNDATVVRSGYGLFWAPWNYAVNNSVGYSQTNTLQQNTLLPITSIDNPFPNGLEQPSGNSLGLLSGVGSSVSFVNPDRDAPRVQQYSVDFQRELPGNMSATIGYVGARGSHLGFGTNININQLPREYAALGNQLVQLVDNPFFGKPGAGAFATQRQIQRIQLLLPYPQFTTVNMTDSTAARSQYHALVLQLRKRVSGWLGGNFNYTFSRLQDNQIGQGNYYSSAPGIVDNYSYIPGSPVYNPDVDYGLSLLDSPHKLSISPIVQLPFGSGRRFMNKGGVADLIAGGWTVSAVISVQSGFPIGVSQTPNTLGLNGAGQRPNIVPGQSYIVGGDITERLERNPGDNLYLNPDAFSLAPAFTFGNAPRILPGVRSPMRNSADLAVNKEIRLGGTRRATVRFEVINLTNTPWYAALASVSKGSASFGQVTTQANYSRLMQWTVRVGW